MKKSTSKGNLVDEFKLGNTRIKIYDSAYVNRTPEEIERTLQNIVDITTRHYERKVQKKKIKCSSKS